MQIHLNKNEIQLVDVYFLVTHCSFVRGILDNQRNYEMTDA